MPRYRRLNKGYTATVDIVLIIFLISVGNSAFGQIVRGHFKFNRIPDAQSDLIHSHFTGQMRN